MYLYVTQERANYGFYHKEFIICLELSMGWGWLVYYNILLSAPLPIGPLGFWVYLGLGLGDWD